MINNNFRFDHKIFSRLYEDLVQLRIEIQSNPKEHQGHEWINIDDIIEYRNRMNDKRERK